MNEYWARDDEALKGIEPVEKNQSAIEPEPVEKVGNDILLQESLENRTRSLKNGNCAIKQISRKRY